MRILEGEPANVPPHLPALVTYNTVGGLMPLSIKFSIMKRGLGLTFFLDDCGSQLEREYIGYVKDDISQNIYHL